MKKRFTALFMIMALMIVSAMPVLAANQTYTADGTATCTVTASLESSYTVSLPATIALSYDSTEDAYKGTFQTGAKGNIASNKQVTLSAPATFNLTGAASGETVSATITGGIGSWESAGLNANTFSNKSGTITAPITKADNYSGTFTFTCALEDAS